jgi:hypothetical protein
MTEAHYDPAEMRLAYEDYRGALEFEHELIDRKLTRLLGSQALLFAGASFAADRADAAFIRLLAGAGLAVCLVVAFGMAGNFRAKYHVYTDYKSFVKNRGPKWPFPGGSEVQWGARTTTTKWGLWADSFLPAVFAAAWVVMLALADRFAR